MQMCMPQGEVAPETTAPQPKPKQRPVAVDPDASPASNPPTVTSMVMADEGRDASPFMLQINQFGIFSHTTGPRCYLWRAVDQEGEILESYITKTRDKEAALTFTKKALKRHGSPEKVTTDGLRSYRAAMNELGNVEKQEIGRWANNRVEDSHLSFRRRERALLRFRRMNTLQKFASVHANIHNHFNQERHRVDRQTYKDRRSAALAE